MKWRTRSGLRDDFGPESDVDVLAHFEEEARHTLYDLDYMGENGRRDSDATSISSVGEALNRVRITPAAKLFFNPPRRSVRRLPVL